MTFSVDRDQVFWPGECVIARWQVEGVREVYVNGIGVVGAGEREICPAAGAPTLTLRTMDDQTLRYVLPVRIVTLNLTTYALLGLAIVALVGIVRLGGFPAARRGLMGARRGWGRLRAAARYAAGWLGSPYVVVTLLMLLGAVLRFHDLAQRALVQDEVALYQIASGTVGQVIEQNAVSNSSPPLFPLMINLVLHVGSSELFLRAISAFASIAVIPMMYALSRQFFSRAASYLCALVVTVSLAQVYYAQYVREYSLTVLLAGAILLTYVRYSRAPTRARLTALAACWVAGILMQYGLPLLIVGLNLLLIYTLLRRNWRAYLVPLAALQMALLLAVALVYVVSLREHMLSGRFGSDSYIAGGFWDQVPNTLLPMIANNSLSVFRSAFGSGIFGQGWETDAFLLVTALGVLVIVTDPPARTHARLLFFLPFAVALAAALHQLYPYHGSRQTIFLTVIVYLFCAAAFDFLLRLSAQRVVAILTAGLCLLVVGSGFSNVQGYYAAPGFDDVKPVVAYLERNTGDDDRVLVIGYARLMFDYYTTVYPSELASTQVLYAGAEPAEYGAFIDTLRQQYGRIWVVLAKDQHVFEATAAEQPYGAALAQALASTNVSLYLIGQ